MNEYKRFTSACSHVYNISENLNKINMKNPDFTDDDLKHISILIGCMETALTDLKKEFEKIKELKKHD